MYVLINGGGLIQLVGMALIYLPTGNPLMTRLSTEHTNFHGIYPTDFQRNCRIW